VQPHAYTYALRAAMCMHKYICLAAVCIHICTIIAPSPHNARGALQPLYANRVRMKCKGEGEVYGEGESALGASLMPTSRWPHYEAPMHLG